MSFLYEKDLKETFWKSYNNNNRAKRHQFECPIREGNADLITIERFQEQFQINAFEFKLSDIKKVLLQAEANIPFVNKSWIVIPQEKEQMILDKYLSVLKEKRYIGVIGVEPSGKYKIIFQPFFQAETKSNQALTNLMMRTF